MNSKQTKMIKRFDKDAKTALRALRLDKDPKKAELENKLFDAADVAKKEGVE